MMERLLARGREIGARRMEELTALVEQAAIEELPPDIRVERTNGGVAILGRRLMRRLLSDARLRGLGLMMKGRIG